MKLSEHIQISKKAVGLLFSLSREYTICLILHSILGAALPYVPITFSARLVDALYAGEPVEVLAVLAALTVGIVFLISLADTYVSSRQEASMDAVFRNEDWKYSEKAMQMAYESIEDRDVANLCKRIKKEAQTGYDLYYAYHCVESLIHHMTKVILSFSLTISFFFLDSISLPAKLAFVGGMLLTIACGILTTWKAEKLNNRLFEANVDLNVMGGRYSDYLEDYSSGKDIRLYDMSSGLSAFYENIFAECNERERKKNLKTAWIRMAELAMNHALKFGTYMLLLSAALSGDISVGSIAKYVACVMLMLSAVSGAVSEVQMIFVNNKYLKRYFSYFDIPNHMYQGSLTVEKRDDNEYDIEFRDVSFRYPHTESYALRHVNLKFRVGGKMAVVGMNGSGKTTFIKLLCRLYDPDEGEILLNGVNIKKYDYEEYLSIFSVVFQDFGLFAFSLGQNVAADSRYDAGRVERSLKQAGFGERLAAMPAGLETYLYKKFDKDGVEISGGEAQKIALARALYKDAPFIILDEPTAALDPVSEYEVYSKFSEIAGDKTAVYISHRLASCRFCDKIAVFDKGQIVQTGSHRELLAEEQGKYYELWHAQAQYYTGDTEKTF